MFDNDGLQLLIILLLVIALSTEIFVRRRF